MKGLPTVPVGNILLAKGLGRKRMLKYRDPLDAVFGGEIRR